MPASVAPAVSALFTEAARILTSLTAGVSACVALTLFTAASAAPTLSCTTSLSRFITREIESVTPTVSVRADVMALTAASDSPAVSCNAETTATTIASLAPDPSEIVCNPASVVSDDASAMLTVSASAFVSLLAARSAITEVSASALETLAICASDRPAASSNNRPRRNDTASVIAVVSLFATVAALLAASLHLRRLDLPS